MLILVFGVVSYVLFLGVFLYAIGFVANMVVPKSIDTVPFDWAGSTTADWVINGALLSVFALTHSIMARPSFKRWWTSIVPKAAERSVYVMVSNLSLALLYWQWRPLPETVWNAGDATLGTLLLAVSFAGWGLALISTFLINHFDLFGLRQVWLHAKGVEYTHVPFIERSLYRFVRHPLLLGFLIAFWATPHMTQGHLFFAVMTTAYTLVAIRFEERNTADALGADYIDYRKRTPMLLPFTKSGK